MGGLLDTLYVGVNGLAAQEVGLHSAGGNIANSTAPGYHREDVRMTSGGMGGGVQKAELQRASNDLLERGVFEQASNKSMADERLTLLQWQVEPLLADLSEKNLNGILGQFFTAWRDLSSEAANPAKRGVVLSTAQELASRLNSTRLGLTNQQTGVDEQLVKIIDSANTHISNIADLNVRIIAGRSGGKSVGDLEDARDRSGRELAELVGAQILHDNNGDMRVIVSGGFSVVSNSAAMLLGTSVDPTTGFHHVAIPNSYHDNIDSRITGGKVGGILKVRDTDLQGFVDDLDKFAAQFATSINTIHNANYGLDGQTGRDLFVSPGGVTANYAAVMALDPSMTNQAALGTSVDLASLPSDNIGINNILAAEDAASATTRSGAAATFNEALADLVNNAGNIVFNARGQSAMAASQLRSAEALAQTQIGVNMEEQLIQIMRYQSAFQAAAKVISTVDEMLQTLVGM